MPCPGRAPAASPACARPRTRAGIFTTALIALAAALLTPASAAGQVQEFALPTGTYPGGIATGPDGNIWFTAEGTAQIGRMTPAGAVTLFPVPGGTPSPGLPTDPGFVAPVDQITAGPDGNLWFTMPAADRIGRMTPAGAVTTWPLPTTAPFAAGARPEGITAAAGALWFTAAGLGKIGRASIAEPPAFTAFPSGSGLAGSGLSDITTGPDGRLWFTAQLGNQIGALVPGSDTPSYFPVPAPSSEPSGITPGPDGALWFTESAANQIGKITTSGAITEYPGAGAGPSAIEVGRDGALWFTESESNAIGRITTGGVVTNHFAVPTPGSEPSDVATGPDGALWFTELAAHKIGRIDTASPAAAPAPPALAIKPPTRKRCKVPKVKGLSVKKAKKKLRKARCRFRVKGRGYVVSTKPRAGKRTAKIVRVKAKRRKPRARSTATTASAGAIR